MNVRVVVADERQANFFDVHKLNGPLALRTSIENPTGGMKDLELETDRAGRRFGGGSGAQPAHHHGVNGERSTERHELTQFAKEVAQRIHNDRVRHEFDRLVIVAGPKMLGLLRQELPDTCKGVLAGEIPKDLVKQGPDAVREVLPRDLFFE